LFVLICLNLTKFQKSEHVAINDIGMRRDSLSNLHRDGKFHRVPAPPP
jgi:hypothetical protein